MKNHFIGERITIGGRFYTVRALLPDVQGLTVESVDGFRTDVDAACVDDEPPSFRRVAEAVDAARDPGRCRTCGAALGLAGGRRCAACWEVETQLADYLRRGGRNALAVLLKAVRESGLLPNRPLTKKDIVL